MAGLFLLDDPKADALPLPKRSGVDDIPPWRDQQLLRVPMLGVPSAGHRPAWSAWTPVTADAAERLP